MAKDKKIWIYVYVDNGNTYQYPVDTVAQAREHAAAIIKDGYFHTRKNVLEIYPPHRILKVKVFGPGVDTVYADLVWGI
jgi:hypothetical protein